MVQGLGDKLVANDKIEAVGNTRQPCKQLFYTHNINWNGDHAFCCHDPFGKSVLGNMKDITIQEAWNAALKKEEVERQKEGVYVGLCEKCVDFNNW